MCMALYIEKQQLQLRTRTLPLLLLSLAGRGRHETNTPPDQGVFSHRRMCCQGRDQAARAGDDREARVQLVAEVTRPGPGWASEGGRAGEAFQVVPGPFV